MNDDLHRRVREYERRERDRRDTFIAFLFALPFLPFAIAAGVKVANIIDQWIKGNP